MMKTVADVRAEIKETEAKIWHGSVWRFLQDGRDLYLRGTPEQRYIDTAQTVLSELFENCSFNVMGVSNLCFKTDDHPDARRHMVYAAQHHFLRDPNGSKDDFVLNFRKFEISPDHFRIVSRPTPISFRLGHIFNRYRERVHEEFPMDELNSAHGVALAITQAIDKKMQKEKLRLLPFVFPTETGFFLGDAERSQERITYADFYLLETALKGPMTTSPYQWFSNVKMTAKTFISRNDMKPEQKRLHDILKPYVVSGQTDDTRRSVPFIADYLSLQAEILPSDEWGADTLRDNISNLIDSKLWKSAVRFSTFVAPPSQKFIR